MQTNNKLREALSAGLEQVNKVYDILSRPCVFIEEARQGCREARGVLIPALTAPPRNCDVGTAEEQRVRFEAWCEKQPERYCKACAECPTQRYAINCFCKWAQMPYEEGDTK